MNASPTYVMLLHFALLSFKSAFYLYSSTLMWTAPPWSSVLPYLLILFYTNIPCYLLGLFDNEPVSWKEAYGMETQKPRGWFQQMMKWGWIRVEIQHKAGMNAVNGQGRRKPWNRTKRGIWIQSRPWKWRSVSWNWIWGLCLWRRRWGTASSGAAEMQRGCF